MKKITGKQLKKFKFKPGDVVMNRLSKEIYVIIEPATSDDFDFVNVVSMFNGQRFISFESHFTLIHRSGQ